jgi:hypothetical protein
MCDSDVPPTSTAVVGQIESFLEEMVSHLTPDPIEAKPGRPRVLPALALWGGVLVCVLRGYSSTLALWRLLTQLGLWSYPRFPVSDQAVYKRLAQPGSSPLAALFGQVQAVLAERLAPYVQAELVPFAAGVYAIDQTRLDPVARKLPVLRSLPATDSTLLPGTLAGVFDLRRQQWHTLQLTDDPHENERVPARSMVADLPVGSLVLADLGYFGFHWFDDLTDAGHYWLSRLPRGVSYEIVHTFYQQGDTLEGLIWLGKHRADRAKYAVRLVQYRRGKTLHQYITNVRDPRRFPLAEVAHTYARRWDIEMAIQLVKEHLGLRLLWGCKQQLVIHQVWAVLIIAQILQALRLEIAGQAGVDPFEVSMPLLVEYVPQLLAEGIDPVAFFVERGRAAGFIRPSRRIQIEAPVIPVACLAQPPPDLPLERSPRYAGKIGIHPNPRPGWRWRN